MGLILSFVVTVLAVLLVLWLIGQFYPNAPKFIVAILIAILILLVLFAMRGWVCSWMCA